MTTSKKVHRFAGFTLNSAKRTLFHETKEIKIKDRDFEVLLFLIESAPRHCSPDEIIENVWGGTTVSNNSVEKIITNIRKLINDKAKEPLFIKTTHGKGYSFIGEVTTLESDQLNSSTHLSDQLKRSFINQHKYVFFGTLAGILLLFLLVYKGVSYYQYNVEAQKIKKVVLDSQLEEFEIYKHPETYSYEKVTAYFMTVEQGGLNLPKIDRAVNRLIKNGWRYSDETKSEWFEFLDIDIWGDSAEARTVERWYAPLIDKDGKLIPGRKPKLEWRAAYLMKKVDGKWLVRETTTPYKQD